MKRLKPSPRAPCAACQLDDAMLRKWAASGGALPARVCRIRHGVACVDCGKRLTENPDRRCDGCHNKWTMKYAFRERA
jgi:hypothetical protein